MSDLRIQRQRDADLGDALGRFGGPGSEGGISVLVQTFAEATYPTAAGAFYAVHPVDVDGNETEGDAATFTADAARAFHAYNLGSEIPPEGAITIAHASDGLWFFTYCIKP